MSTSKRLLRSQLVLLGFVIGFLMIFGAIRGTTDLLNHRNTDDKIAVSHKQQHFWREVDGSDPFSATVGGKFARDIRSLDSKGADSFRGNSNAYGGVVDEIGFDPFNSAGLNCFECGPLSSSTKANLDAVHHGDISSVVSTFAVPGAGGTHFTPFSLSIWATIGWVWLAGGPLTLLGAWLWLDRPDLKQVSSTDVITKWSLFTITPDFWFAYHIGVANENARENRKIRTAFPEHMEVLDSVDRALGHLDPEEAKHIRTLRDSVRKELALQSYVSTSDNQYADDLVKELKDVQEYLDARVEAKRELSKGLG